MATVIEFPEGVTRVTRVTEQALTWPERAKGTAVVDAASYSAAGELLKGIKALRAEVDAAFDPIIQANFRAHRTACEQKRQAEAPLTEAERIIKSALVKFDDEQERIRRAEQARLEREARERAEAEALERAAAMEQEGRDFGDASLVEEAHQLIQDQLTAPPPPVATVAKATPKIAGITYREIWKYRVKDATKVPEQYKVVNDQAVGGMVRALKGATNIPGIEVYSERVVAAGPSR